jgi:hypothetical protein
MVLLECEGGTAGIRGDSIVSAGHKGSRILAQRDIDRLSIGEFDDTNMLASSQLMHHSTAG